jgi:hypothetical protein
LIPGAGVTLGAANSGVSVSAGGAGAVGTGIGPLVIALGPGCDIPLRSGATTLSGAVIGSGIFVFLYAITNYNCLLLNFRSTKVRRVTAFFISACATREQLKQRMYKGDWRGSIVKRIHASHIRFSE